MKTRLFLAGGAAALLAFAASGAQAAVNLLANGSFETGDFSGWTLSGGATDGYPASVITYNSTASYPTGAFNEPVPVATGSFSPDAAGTHAAYFVSDFANETLSQSVFLKPGVYTIGFSAYAPANGYGNAGDAEFSGSVAGVTLADYKVSSSPDLTWRNFTGTVNITTAGFYDTSFTFNTNLFPSKDVVIDQAFIVAGNVPEPATWAMMLVGFGGMGAAMRARRRQAAATA